MKIKFRFKLMETKIDKIIDNLKNDLISQLNNKISDDIVINKENTNIIIQHLEDLKILKNDINDKIKTILDYVDFNPNTTINQLLDRKIKENNDNILVNIDTNITNSKRDLDIFQQKIDVINNQVDTFKNTMTTNTILLNNWKIDIDNKDRLCFKKKISNQWKLKYLIQ